MKRTTMKFAIFISSIILVMHYVPTSAEEYYINILSEEQSGGVFGFDLEYDANVPELLIEIYYPEDSEKEGELRYTTLFNSRILEVFNGKARIEQSMRSDPEGEYRIVLSYGECSAETVFVLEGTEQYWAWYDHINGNVTDNNDADKEEDKKPVTGGNEKVTAIILSENNISMYQGGERNISVDCSKSITIEIEDESIVEAKYENNTLYIKAINPGTSSIWLRTNDNYNTVKITVFYDIAKDASDWAKSDIRRAVEMGFVPPEIQGEWTRSITREEFAKMAVMFLGIAPVNETPFSDTTSSYVAAAFNNGIVNGIGNNKFDPKGKITRQEAAVMLMRCSKYLNIDVLENESYTFLDDDKISLWARDGVTWVEGMNIMHGDENGMFNPHNEYTCEQAITTFLRMKALVTI